jgi:hypothetical protein
MKDLSKAERIFYGIAAIYAILVFVFQLLRYFGVINAGPYLN